MLGQQLQFTYFQDVITVCKNIEKRSKGRMSPILFSTFSNSVSISPRYLTVKLENSESVVWVTSQSQNLVLVSPQFFKSFKTIPPMIAVFTNKRISSDWPFRSIQRVFDSATPCGVFFKTLSTWLRGENDTEEFL